MSTPNPFAAILELQARARAGSLRDAIAFSLSQDPRPRNIHPDLLGGSRNPIMLDPVSVDAPTPSELQRRMYEAIYPVAYGAQQWAPGEEGTPSQSRATRVGRAIFGMENTERLQAQPSREDAWRLYLGMPQEANTFSPSVFKPSNAEDPNASYLSLTLAEENPKEFLNLAWSRPLGSRNDGKKDLEILLRYIEEDGRASSEDRSGVMGNFTFTSGEDENGSYIAYYDNWDLDPSNFQFGDKAHVQNTIIDRVGRPFEIYGRIYYDPETKEILPAEEQPAQRLRRSEP